MNEAINPVILGLKESGGVFAWELTKWSTCVIILKLLGNYLDVRHLLYRALYLSGV